MESNRTIRTKYSNTKLEQANEQLKVQDRVQKEFINIAAHELRTPIQPILGLSDILLRSKPSEEKQSEMLNIIVRNAKRLLRLTEDILDITKIESKSLELKKEQFNLSEMLQNVTSDFQSQLSKEDRATNLKLECIGLNKDIIVEADKGRINQVVSNILSNAIKFTQEGNVSVIVVETNNDYYVTVTIKDTGPGIDAEIFPKLFTKFVTKATTGTGLGLYISKSIVEAHGGRIWAENNKDDRYGGGCGASFSFEIPISSSYSDSG